MKKSTKTAKVNRQRKTAVKPKKYNAIEITSNETNGDNDSDVICTGSYEECLDAIEKAFNDMGKSDECDLDVNNFDREDEDTWVHYSCDGNEGEVVTTWKIKKAR